MSATSLPWLNLVTGKLLSYDTANWEASFPSVNLSLFSAFQHTQKINSEVGSKAFYAGIVHEWIKNC